MSFMDADFLLQTPTAKILYHQYAAHMPIIDYHCHLDPREIYEDVRFENITRLWLGGDHYKWRLMRSNGVAEYYITGNAPDWEKFEKFAQTLPKAIGNPMYHWCHLELKRYFGYEGVLNGATARQVWDLVNEKLAQPGYSARGLIARSNVAMIGTTDDPCSDLQWHIRLREDKTVQTRVLPSFRPDPALNIHKPGFVQYLQKLSAVSGVTIRHARDVAKALSQRIEFFHAVGCRAADHGLDYVMYRQASEEEVEAVFQKVLSGNAPTRQETEVFQTYLLLHCAGEYARYGWAMQLHFSCARNTNTKMLRLLGADTGFDAMAVTDSCANLYQLMDRLCLTEQLPKTILYSLNPADDQWLDTLIGCYQSEQLPGKIQHGSAWWFNDHKKGMENQLTSLANLSLLGNFIGMLTDSRSFLSYTRHEYFRRILCNLIGGWVENGEYPSDLDSLGALVQDICYYNAKRYFELEEIR